MGMLQAQGVPDFVANVIPGQVSRLRGCDSGVPVRTTYRPLLPTGSPSPAPHAGGRPESGRRVIGIGETDRRFLIFIKRTFRAVEFGEDQTGD